MAEKKAIAFPRWVEGLLAIVLIAMAVIEFRHDQIFWAALFGVFGILTAVTLFRPGESHDGK